MLKAFNILTNGKQNALNLLNNRPQSAFKGMGNSPKSNFKESLNNGNTDTGRIQAAQKSEATGPRKDSGFKKLIKQ